MMPNFLSEKYFSCLHVLQPDQPCRAGSSHSWGHTLRYQTHTTLLKLILSQCEPRASTALTNPGGAGCVHFLGDPSSRAQALCSAELCLDRTSAAPETLNGCTSILPLSTRFLQKLLTDQQQQQLVLLHLLLGILKAALVSLALLHSTPTKLGSRFTSKDGSTVMVLHLQQTAWHFTLTKKTEILHLCM